MAPGIVRAVKCIDRGELVHVLAKIFDSRTMDMQLKLAFEAEEPHEPVATENGGDRVPHEMTASTKSSTVASCDSF